LKLRYTDRAARQIDAALDYIAERSPRGAAVVQQRILAMEALLEGHPYAGHPTSRPGVRRLALTPHPISLII
jgi:plasmid stabilization system protein ParE